MRGWLVVVAVGAVGLAGCGRVGFSAHEPTSSDADTNGAADAAPDAVPDAFVAVCGDGLCSGNLGESCPACAADCKTTQPVCGNGTCDAGESSATCAPDCGPTPWTFGQMETDFLTEINAKRVAGTPCTPMGPMGAMESPLARDPADPAYARHLAWEIAHDNNMLATTKTCSGADMEAAFVNPAGYSYAVFGWNYFDGTSAADGLIADASTCSYLMDPARTTAMVGVASDVSRGYVIFLK